MTAKNFLDDSEIFETVKLKQNKVETPIFLYDDVQRIMKEFAELKCQELLEIVAEKAETKPYSTSTSIDFSKLIVNKDSILNAVDLKEFIK